MDAKAKVNMKYLLATALIGIGVYSMSHVRCHTGWLRVGVVAAGIVLVFTGLKVGRGA